MNNSWLVMFVPMKCSDLEVNHATDISEKELELFADCWSTPEAYWQGAVRVSGTHREGPVQGRRFMELVGYGPQQLKQTPAL